MVKNKCCFCRRKNLLGKGKDEELCCLTGEESWEQWESDRFQAEIPPHPTAVSDGAVAMPANREMPLTHALSISRQERFDPGCCR